jgi:hypothetical protein
VGERITADLALRVSSLHRNMFGSVREHGVGTMLVVTNHTRVPSAERG